jgi:hypothetical protein
LLPPPAYAHGFGERYDLPVPLWLYIGGAGVAVALSFAVIGFFVKGTPRLDDHPHHNLLRWRAGRVLVHPIVITSAKVASVTLFALVLLSGAIGAREPTENLAPTLVWVLWWVGLAYVSALIGNLWALINPWKITFGWAESAFERLNPEGELPLYLQYPNGLGVWPGVLLFAGFSWLELVYAESAVPVRIAQMILVYSFITWSGMLLFGRERWLRYGEAFSIVFGFLARFAPSEVRVVDQELCDDCEINCQDQDDHCIGCGDCLRRASSDQWELNLRPFAAGLLRSEPVSTSMMVFVVLLLATVTFDGFTATPVWADIVNRVHGAVPNLTLIESLGLVVFPAMFIGVYLVVVALMTAVSGNRVSAGDMARSFVYSLIPIALAYHLAHFFGFLLIQGQLIFSLVSDPFGFGWDIFGTSDYRVNIAIVNARFAWFTAVSAIVIGHIIAVYLAHAVAIRVLKDHRRALRSQIPMLALMVGYTMFSLWILAQPIVETTGSSVTLISSVPTSADAISSSTQAPTVISAVIAVPTARPTLTPLSPTKAPVGAPTSTAPPTITTTTPPRPTIAIPAVNGQSGKLVHKNDGVTQVEHYQVGEGDRSHATGEDHAHLNASDFVASATFANPYATEDGNWDYGFLFRQTGTNTFHAVGITSDGKWYHRVRTGSPESGRLVGVGPATSAELAFGMSNRIDLWASGSSGSLYINGSLAVLLDLEELTTAGDIAVSTGFFGGQVEGRSTDFIGFTVSPL